MQNIRYTHRIATASTAVSAIYFDEFSYDLWVEFHNGTVVHRAWRHGIDTLLGYLDDCGHSLGTLWNRYLKDVGSLFPATNVKDVQFMDRATLDATTLPQDDATDVSEDDGNAVSYMLTLSIEFPGLSMLDVAKVVDALNAAGIKHRVSGGEAW